MIEHEILDVLRNMDDSQKRRVLEFARHIGGEVPEKAYSARELMQLPVEERRRLVAEAIQASANEDFETFEAYSEEDFDEHS